jgi:hypothetical protein
MSFDNDKATDEQRVEFLDCKDAMVENHGDDDEPRWVLFYKGTSGQEKSMDLDAQTWEDAIYESCNFLSH